MTCLLSLAGDGGEMLHSHILSSLKPPDPQPVPVIGLVRVRAAAEWLLGHQPWSHLHCSPSKSVCIGGQINSWLEMLQNWDGPWRCLHSLPSYCQTSPFFLGVLLGLSRGPRRWQQWVLITTYLACLPAGVPSAAPKSPCTCTASPE